MFIWEAVTQWRFSYIYLFRGRCSATGLHSTIYFLQFFNSACLPVLYESDVFDCSLQKTLDLEDKVQYVICSDNSGWSSESSRLHTEEAFWCIYIAKCLKTDAYTTRYFMLFIPSAFYRGVGVRVPIGSRIFSTSSRPGLGPTQSPIQWVPRALSRG
jgi:hypothetical protein